MRFSFVVVAALFACGPACADASVREPTKANPDAGCERWRPLWKLPAMIEAAARGTKPKIARVLTWKIEEDDRPLRLETALVWLQGDKSWTLTHLYRHPQDGPSAAWQVSMVYDVPYEGQRSYDHAPTRADFERFVDATWWKFGSRERGWKLLDSEVCRDAWRAAFSVEPWHSYEK